MLCRGSERGGVLCTVHDYKNQNLRFTGINTSISRIMPNMTIIDPDIVYFRLSASGAFYITYNVDLIYFVLYVTRNLTLFMIYLVSMLHSNLSNCLRSWLNNSITIHPLLVRPLRNVRISSLSL